MWGWLSWCNMIFINISTLLKPALLRTLPSFLWGPIEGPKGPMGGVLATGSYQMGPQQVLQLMVKPLWNPLKLGRDGSDVLNAQLVAQSHRGRGAELCLSVWCHCKGTPKKTRRSRNPQKWLRTWPPPGSSWHRRYPFWSSQRWWVGNWNLALMWEGGWLNPHAHDWNDRPGLN